MIPKNIYFTYKDTVPDIVFQRWKNLNNNFTTYFYNDSQCFEFIKENFDIDYANYFNEIKIGPYKADFWRLCILYIKGGIYSDIDIVPHLSIESFIKDTDVCTCLAMNKKSIFQAFIAAKPKNELIKKCLDSFYNKRNDKFFLNDIKNCAPTYDMYNVFLKFLNKNKIKSNKNYYVENQIIRIFQETGDNYHDAYVSYKGKKIFSSRDKDYVNMNLNGIPWGIKLPLGNYQQTCKKMSIQNNIFYLDCLDINNVFIPNKIKIKNNLYYENLNGFIYSSNIINNNFNYIIPKTVYQKYKKINCKQINDFKYFFYEENEKDKFINNNYKGVYYYYCNQNKVVKNYIWRICIIHKYGGIYVDEYLESNLNLQNFIQNSDFVSTVDITNKINFNFFSACQNSKILESIINSFNDMKNDIIIKKDIVNIGNSTTPIKIIKISGIIDCNPLPYNFQEKYCKDEFNVYVDKHKELLYIYKINDNQGWKQNLELEYYYQNISDILNMEVEKYLFSNMYPILNTNNKYDYIKYNKNILNLTYNKNYSESL